MTRAWCVIVVLAAAGIAVGAETNDVNYPDDPNELLRTTWDAVFVVLQNKDVNEEAKVDEINRILTPIFDFALMAKLTLGEKHWPKLSGPQREEFTRLFVEKLRTSYREKISLYTDEKASFMPPVEAKKGTICIPMELVSDERKVELRYKLRKADGRWKIYDVEIEGVSVLLTYRSQFDDILSRGTVEDLFARLGEQAAR